MVERKKSVYDWDSATAAQESSQHRGDDGPHLKDQGETRKKATTIDTWFFFAVSFISALQSWRARRPTAYMRPGNFGADMAGILAIAFSGLFSLPKQLWISWPCAISSVSSNYCSCTESKRHAVGLAIEGKLGEGYRWLGSVSDIGPNSDTGEGVGVSSTCHGRTGIHSCWENVVVLAYAAFMKRTHNDTRRQAEAAEQFNRSI